MKETGKAWTCAEAGRLGGQRAKAKIGPDGYAAMGELGGKVTRDRYGPDHFKKIGAMGGRAMQEHRQERLEERRQADRMRAEQDGIYTVRQAAEKEGLTVASIYQAISRGKLLASREGEKILIAARDLAAYRQWEGGEESAGPAGCEADGGRAGRGGTGGNDEAENVRDANQPAVWRFA